VSGLAGLYNVPSTDQERAQWAFVHMAHHRDINRTIYELIKVAWPEWPRFLAVSIALQLCVFAQILWGYDHDGNPSIPLNDGFNFKSVDVPSIERRPPHRRLSLRARFFRPELSPNLGDGRAGQAAAVVG